MKSTEREGPGRCGTLYTIKAVGKIDKELAFACESVGCYVGHALA